jgi:hypothetical protein
MQVNNGKSDKLGRSPAPRNLGWGFTIIAVLLVAGLSPSSLAAARRDLTIGITQFPSTLNPNMDAMAAKSYVLGLVRPDHGADDREYRSPRS